MSDKPGVSVKDLRHVDLERRELERIDDICGAFEESWNRGISPESIGKIVAKNATPGSPEYDQLLVELAQVDIECRWRELANKSIEVLPEESPAEFIGRQKIPCWQDYSRLFSGAADRGLLDALLVDCELRSRLKFGDAPSPSIFGMSDCGDKKYTRLMPVASVLVSGRKQFSSPYCGTLRAGRQDVNDPDPITLVASGNESRLICTPLVDKSISRRQFTVQVFAGKAVRIGNSSTNRYFRIDGKAPLEPGQSVMGTLPLEIDLDSLVIRLNRPQLERD